MIFSNGLTSSDYATLVQNSNAPALVYNNDLLDLLEPYLHQSFLHPGANLIGGDPNKGWVNLDPLWSLDWHFAARADRADGAVTLTSSRLALQFDAPRDDEYAVFALPYVSTTGSNVSFDVDAMKLGTVSTMGNNDLGFTWTNVGNITLRSGHHSLAMSAGSGLNAMLKLIVVPKGVLEQTIASLPFNRYILLSEAETFGQPVSVTGASLGKGMILWSGPILTEKFDAWDNATKPSGWTSPNYSLLLKSATGSLSTLKVLPNGSTFRDISGQSIGTSNLKLNFSVSVSDLPDPNSPDNWGSVIIQFNDGSSLFYAAGGPLGVRNSPTQRIIMVANGTTNGFLQVSRDVQSDVQREFGTQKTISRVYLATHTAEASFGPLELFKTRGDTINASMYVPRTGDYDVYVRARKWLGSTESLGSSLSISLGVTQMSTDIASDGFHWYNFSSTYAQPGSRLTFSVSGASVVVDSIMISNRGLLRSLTTDDSTPQTSFKETQLGPSEYTLTGQTGSPFYLGFNQKFDPRWEATLNGHSLQKWALNGLGALFFVPAWGTFTLRLTFTAQWLYTAGLYTTIGTSILLVVIAVISGMLMSIPRRLRRIRFNPQRLVNFS
jgi:hypothetical protein